MKIKGSVLFAAFALVTLLTGCEPLLVLDPKGPQAERLASDIIFSMGLMTLIVIVVFALLAYMLIKYRASKQSEDYEPPHIEGSPLVESIIVGIPVIIIIILSIVSVRSNYIVEATPEEYEDTKPLVVYASSSNWKWHFSYPEENIETVNYLYVPTDRALEIKLYSHDSITSFWVPELAGQKYAMGGMVNTLHMAASVPGEFMGRNANFNGEGFAENSFAVKAMPQNEFDDWVVEVQETADPLTEERFTELLEPGHLGQMTFTGTHLEFSPPPTGHEHTGEMPAGSETEENSHDTHDSHNMEEHAEAS